MAEYKAKLLPFAKNNAIVDILLYETTETFAVAVGRNTFTPDPPVVAGYTVVGLVSAQANTGAQILCDGARTTSVRVWNFDNAAYNAIGFYFTWLLVSAN